MKIFEELKGYDWQAAFECAGVESDEVIMAYSDRRYLSRVGCNSPAVSPCVGSLASSEPVTRDMIKELLGSSAGENDGDDWIALMLLNDGRYAFLSAGCDYTGWDCQSGGMVTVSDSLENILRFGMDENERSRLGLDMEGNKT